MKTTDTDKIEAPATLAERITPGAILQADGDPAFLYILNPQGVNRTMVVIGYGVTDAGERTPKAERYANAELITEAFTICHETGKTPRQLADELTAALLTIADLVTDKHDLIVALTSLVWAQRDGPAAVAESISHATKILNRIKA